MSQSTPPSAAQMRSWAVVVPLVPDAATVFGVSSWTAYELARRGDFPVEVLRLGGRLRCRTADLMRAVGLDVSGVDV